MKCPHCQVEFHDNVGKIALGMDADGAWLLEHQTCPACSRFILAVVGQSLIGNAYRERTRYLARPKQASRPHPPKEVPADFANDYIEASLVLGDSPQASAALSRRCLQHILREKANVKAKDLAKEIDLVLESGTLPSHLSEAIDAVRNIGNFAAHPIKGTNSGEILPVEPGEAEWTLEVLEGLFDFYFVQPAVLKQRRETLNAKLAAASKPPIKG